MVRGEAAIRASVETSYVTGEVDSIGVRPNTIWRGVVATRTDGEPLTAAQAAELATAALRNAGLT